MTAAMIETTVVKGIIGGQRAFAVFDDTMGGTNEHHTDVNEKSSMS
jgi:hypothetical protein